MPRKRLGEQPMTDAERQRKRRERLRQERGPVDPSPAAIIDALRKDNADLRRQLANPAPSAKAAPSSELVEARAEIEKLRKQLAAATKAAPAPTSRAEKTELQQARMDNFLLDKQLRKLEQVTVPKLQARIKKLEAERDAAVDPDSEAARLQKTITSLRETISRNRAEFNRRLASKGLLTFKQASLIAKALHPDATPTKHDRAEAFKAFTAWKSDSKSAR